MRLRTLGAIVGALAAAAALSLAAPTVAAADDKPRPIAACAYRVCVLLTDLVYDSDGDGYADVDEEAAGTDPKDPGSHPSAFKLIDLFSESSLPSFQNQLTEIIVLPQVTPDGKALVTGLGAFNLVPGHYSVFGDMQSLLDGLDTSGFGALNDVYAFFNSVMPKGLADLPWNGATGTAYFHPEWYSGKDGGTTGYGPKVTSPDAGIYKTEYSGNSITIRNDDGGRTESTTGTQSWKDTMTGNPAYEAQTSNTTYDKNGNKVSSTFVQESGSRNTKTGESSKESTKTTNTYDPETGKKTGSTETKTTTEIKDGKKTTTTETTTKDKDGNVTGKTTTKKTEDCPKNKCDGMVDPDYAGTNAPITAQQLGQVVAKLNSVKTPGPDTGWVPKDVKPGKITDRWKPYMLFGADGVMVLGNAGAPNFHTGAVDHDPHLIEMASLGGTVPPRKNPDGTTSWTDGDGTYWP